MKKILFSLLSACILLAACSTNKSSDPTPTTPTTPDPAITSPPPGSYTQKVLVEEFTGTWCQFCPDGAYILQQIIDGYQGQAIGASIHQGDAMEIPLYSALNSTFGVTGFPTGMVSRKTFSGSSPLMSRNAWDNWCWGEIHKDGGCGLAILSSQNETVPTMLDLEVQVAFTKNLSASDVRLTVYVMESKVTGYPQVNAYNNDPTSPFYQQGNPIVDYEHNHTVRKVLTANMGDVIPSAKTVPGKKFTYSTTFGLAGMKAANVTIVAFAHIHGATKTTHEILNVQEAKAGSLQDWD